MKEYNYTYTPTSSYSNTTHTYKWVSGIDYSDYTKWRTPKKFKYSWPEPSIKEGIRERLNEKITIITKNNNPIEISYGEIYEIEKITGKKIEELEEEELLNHLMAIRL